MDGSPTTVVGILAVCRESVLDEACPCKANSQTVKKKSNQIARFVRFPTTYLTAVYTQLSGWLKAPVLPKITSASDTPDPVIAAVLHKG